MIDFSMIDPIEAAIIVAWIVLGIFTVATAGR